MPHASAARELEFAGALVERLAGSAPLVIASHARSAGEREQRAHPGNPGRQHGREFGLRLQLRQQAGTMAGDHAEQAETDDGGLAARLEAAFKAKLGATARVTIVPAGTGQVAFDVRVMAATNRDLEAAIAQSKNALGVLLGMGPGEVNALLGEGALPSVPESIAVGVPANLLRQRPDVRKAELQALALRTFDAVGARGWGRVDILMDEEGQPWVIEVNTVPGMTSHSLVPMAANAVGIDFDELVWRILAQTLEAA